MRTFSFSRKEKGVNLNLKPTRGMDQSKNSTAWKEKSLTGATKKFLPSGKQGQELKQKQEATGPSTTLTAVRTESNGRLGDSVKDYFLYFSVGFSIGGVMLPRESRPETKEKELSRHRPLLGN